MLGHPSTILYGKSATCGSVVATVECCLSSVALSLSVTKAEVSSRCVSGQFVAFILGYAYVLQCPIPVFWRAMLTRVRSHGRRDHMMAAGPASHTWPPSACTSCAIAKPTPPEIQPRRWSAAQGAQGWKGGDFIPQAD